MHNVLIIDDDRELCLLIKRSVLLEDIEADFCNTGKSRITKIKRKAISACYTRCNDAWNGWF